MSNIIAIVGRPNVGKSTLFNRIVKQREAIVDSVSGVTRDRHYGKGDWNGKEFSLIDEAIETSPKFILIIKVLFAEYQYAKPPEPISQPLS